jgi:hypothetical protein
MLIQVSAGEISCCEQNIYDKILLILMGLGQKRGQLLLIKGIVTVTYLETGRIMNVECLTKYCQGCQTHTGKHDFLVNF